MSDGTVGWLQWLMSDGTFGWLLVADVRWNGWLASGG